MERREATLMDNDILLAGVYIDPMYRVTLTEEQKTRAKAALCDLANRMKGTTSFHEDKKHSSEIYGDATLPSILIEADVHQGDNVL